jgi:hypothetical protein
VRVAILGSGAVGARAARQLTTSTEVHEVVLRDTHPSRPVTLAESLGDRARRDTSSTGAVPEGVDVVILATPTGTHFRPAREAVERGVSVVSVSDAVEDVQLLLTLDDAARRHGCNVVVGAGFSPGFTCLLARFGARSFTTVDELHIAKVGTGGRACARQHHRALSGTAVDWRDGEWVRRRGGSGRELSWFPEPLGGRDCYRAARPDAVLLVPEFPGISRVTARLGATRRDRLTMHLPMLTPPHAEGGPGGARVEVRGWRGDAREVAVYGVMDRPAVAAGAVAALAAKAAVDGTLFPPGAGGLARVADPIPMLRDLAERGIRAAVFDGTPRAPAMPYPLASPPPG